MEQSISLQSVRFGNATLSKHIAVLQDEFIFGGHLTAMGAVAKVLFTCVLMGIWIGTLPFLIAYTATLIVYSFDYYHSAKKDIVTNPERALYFQGMSGTFFYRLMAYTTIMVAALAIYSSALIAAVIVAVAAMGVAYSIFFKNLTRHIPGFKNIYTSGIWTIGALLGVMACHPMPAYTALLPIFGFMFLRSLGNVIFFDLKDVLADGAEGLKTVPVLLGRKGTFVLLGALNIVSFLPLVYGILAGVLPAFSLAMIVVAVFTFYSLCRGWSKPNDYMSYVLADAETLTWPAILLIAGGILAL